MQQRFDFRIGERRLAHWFKEVGPNMRTLWEESKDTVKEAAEDGDPIKIAMAPFVLGGRAWFQGTDYLLAGIVDRKVEPVQGSETVHDAKQAVKDLVTLHPLRAAVGVLKLPGDAAMDILKGIGGFRGKARGIMAANTPGKAATSAYADHSLAA